MMEILHREFVYLWYYFELQFRQIAFYWILGMAIGSIVLGAKHFVFYWAFIILFSLLTGWVINILL